MATATTSLAPADFRDAAVAVSEVALGPHATVDPADANVSYCVRAELDGADYIRSARRNMIVASILAISGIVLGGILAIVGQSGGLGEHENAGIAVMCGLVGGGFAVLVAHVLRQRRATRERVLGRLGGTFPQTPIKPLPVAIDNGVTGKKFWPSDGGILLLLPERRCVQIEGVTHRYMIHGGDVERVLLVGGGEHSNAAVVVDYRIGEVRLSLVLTPDQLLKQIAWQLSGRLPELFDQMKKCFSGRAP